MDRLKAFKTKLALIGFLPSLVFAGLVIYFLCLITDFSRIEASSLMGCSALILLVLVPLSILFDRKWQRPLVDLIQAHKNGRKLSGDEVYGLHQMGLRFPMNTYIFNLTWWLLGSLIGCIWFHFIGMASRDIFYVFISAMTGGILCALVQFYAVKSFLWNTLPAILSQASLGSLRRVEPTLSIRTKLLISFLSIIFPALILSNLLAYSTVFKRMRDQDIEKQRYAGRAIMRELSRSEDSAFQARDIGSLVKKYRDMGLTGTLAVYDVKGRLLFEDGTTTLPEREVRELLASGEEQALELGQEATVLVFSAPGGDPKLLMLCPWSVYSAALANVRWMLALSSLTLFVSLIILTFLASHDISRPVKALKDTATKIAGGRMDLRVSVFSDDEMGDLAWAVREMNNRLREWNRSLEIKVKDRTHSLENAYNELFRLYQMKDEFLSSVSHELRTPLTSIRSFSEILIKYPNESESTRTEFLSIINSETERLTRLVNDLLDLAKIESGNREWKDETVIVEPLLDTVAKTFNVLTDGKDLELRVDAEPGIPPMWINRDRLVQVVTNLVSNAVKFTDPGGTIEISANLLAGKRTRDRGDMVHFCVSDTGVGILKNEQEKIFEKFVQGGDTLEDKPRGTGLGLSICKEIVRHYGGDIWVESSPGKGTSIHFTLPCKPIVQERSVSPPADPGRGEHGIQAESTRPQSSPDGKSSDNAVRS